MASEPGPAPSSPESGSPEGGEPKKKRRRYPHAHSILCYSRLVHELHEDGTVTATMPVLPDQLDDGGRVRMGAIAPLVDLCAGLLGAKAVHPDWTATLDFKLHLDHLPDGGDVRRDLVWSYPSPVRESAPIAGLLCFYDEHVDVTVDGEPQPRPVTAFS